MSEVQKIRLLQITDLHFGKTPQCLVNYVNPVMTFNAILDDIDRLRWHEDIEKLTKNKKTSKGFSK